MTGTASGIDPTIRAVIGVALLSIAIFVAIETIWRVVLVALAGVALLTVLARYCPLNSVIGLNACHLAGRRA